MLLETIRCEEGESLHLPYHQKRLEESLQSLGIDTSYDLKTLISPPVSGVFRCRFLYDAAHYSIDYIPYSPKKISSLKLIHADYLEYPLKYSDRHSLNELWEERGECDDVLIVKNGSLTDTTIANIALFIEGKWFTPKSPLLRGTTRERLLDEGVLITASLTPRDLTKATRIAVLNALVGMIEVENGIIS